MALLLWVVMLGYAAVDWVLVWKGAPRWVLMTLAVADAAFTVWVVATQFAVVTVWWLITTMALSLAISFWSDSRARRKQSEPRPAAG